MSHRSLEKDKDKIKQCEFSIDFQLIDILNYTIVTFSQLQQVSLAMVRVVDRTHKCMRSRRKMNPVLRCFVPWPCEIEATLF